MGPTRSPWVPQHARAVRPPVEDMVRFHERAGTVGQEHHAVGHEGAGRGGVVDVVVLDVDAVHPVPGLPDQAADRLGRRNIGGT